MSSVLQVRSQSADSEVPTSTTVPPLRLLWTEVLALIAVLIAGIFGFQNFAYPVLAAWALRGGKASIQALTLTFFATALNPVLAPIPPSSALRWLVILTAAISAIVRAGQHRRLPRVVALALIFCLIGSLLSLITSYAVATSLAKLLSFALGISAVMLSFELTADAAAYWRSWFFTVNLTVLVLSAPTLFIPDIGRALNGTAFQGIFSQPQALGIFLAPCVAWLTGCLLMRTNRSLGVIVSVFLGWVGILASLARTALFAILIAFAVSLLTLLFKNPVAWRRTANELRRHGIVLFTMVLATLMMTAVSAAMWSKVEVGIAGFIAKHDSSETLEESLTTSRGELIRNSLANFVQHPWLGIGFGVASNPSDLSVEREEVLGIVVGAPVEKGFLPSAVIEDVGIIGTIPLLFLLAALLRPAILVGDFALLWLLLTCLMVNLGEAIFFSFGGVGLFHWLIMGMAIMRPAASRSAPANG